jgi:hypothetical protein
MAKNDARIGSWHDPFWELAVRELRRLLGEDASNPTLEDVKRALKEFNFDGLTRQGAARVTDTILAVFNANREEQFNGQS